MTAFKQGAPLALILVSIGLGSCAGTWESRNLERQVNSSNSNEASSGLGNLRQLWEDKIKKLDKQSKDYPVKRLDMLRSLLSEAPEQQLSNELQRITASPIDYSHLDEYEQTFLQAFAVRDVVAQDRVKLVNLLSSKCPRHIGAEPIELYLAHSAIPDPLLVLFDSYDGAATKQAKESLLSVLGDAFKTLRNRFSNNEDFVNASKEWYLSHKDKARINPNYHPNSPFPENQQLLIVESQNTQR